ncbi:hypothetical protein ACFL0G_00825 [Candidatus Zixiibacteriota bacterium]
MAKATAERLIEEIGDDLAYYLKEGVCLDSFSQKIDPSLNINDIERLLRIHFVLTRSTEERVGVVDFVKSLPIRIRRIKTSIEKHPELIKGEVKGRINWSKTISERLKSRQNDGILFVCDRIERNYDIRENLVLKRLLSIIYQIMTVDLKTAMERDYKWLGDWTHERRLIQVLKQTFLKNIHIRQIYDTPRLTDRDLSIAKHSRSKIYRESADLLLRYRKLMSYEFDPLEAKELLANTFVKPDKPEVLFELYWVIQLVRALSSTDSNVKFNIVDGASNIVAEWTDEKFKYRIYHDSTGSFTFHEKISKQPAIEGDNYFVRKLRLMKKWNEYLHTYFEFPLSDTLWGGRPDIILEKYELSSNNLCQVFIGEVKYTQRPDYAAEGLRELMEYMVLLRSQGKYYSPLGKLFDNERLKGFLFVDDVPISPFKAGSVELVKYGSAEFEMQVS